MANKVTAKLTAEEIVNIIKAGHEAKVESLCYLGLKVTYQSEQASSPINPDFTITQEPTETATNQRALQFEEELQKQLLMVSDPLAYEESLLLDKDDE